MSVFFSSYEKSPFKKEKAMQVATLITTDASGKVYATKLIPSEEEAIELPEPLAGPFLYTFALEDKNGLQEFSCKVLVNQNSFVVMFEIFPVLAEVKTILLPTAKIEKFTEHENQEVKVGRLNIEKVYQNGKYLVISWIGGQSPMCLITDDQEKQFSIPFYNFYENSSICLGNLKGMKGSGLEKLNRLVSSITTPHRTFDDGSLVFRYKNGEVIEDKGGKVRNQRTDIPEMKANVKKLLSKPIARLTP